MICTRGASSHLPCNWELKNGSLICHEWSTAARRRTLFVHARTSGGVHPLFRPSGPMRLLPGAAVTQRLRMFGEEDLLRMRGTQVHTYIFMCMGFQCSRNITASSL